MLLGNLTERNHSRQRITSARFPAVQSGSQRGVIGENKRWWIMFINEGWFTDITMLQMFCPNFRSALDQLQAFLLLNMSVFLVHSGECLYPSSSLHEHCAAKSGCSNYRHYSNNTWTQLLLFWEILKEQTSPVKYLNTDSTFHAPPGTETYWATATLQ